MRDDFSERFFPVDGRKFVVRSGTWRCELDGPVDVSGVDRRVFPLRFFLVKQDARWKGAPTNERRLENCEPRWQHFITWTAKRPDMLGGWLW